MDQYKSIHVLVVYEEGKSTTSLSQEGLWEKPGHMKDLALHEIARILHVRALEGTLLTIKLYGS